MRYCYRIRSKTTGLFSSGGADPQWTKKGKLWQSIGHVKNHINMVRANLRYYYPKDSPKRQRLLDYLADSEIVEFELREEEAKVLPIPGEATGETP